LIGISLSLLAGLGFALTAVFARLGLQHISTTSGTLISLFFSTVGAMIILLIVKPSDVFSLNGEKLLWLFFVGLFNFPLGRLFNYLAVRFAGVSKASTVVATSPLFGTALAVAFLGEIINIKIFIGAVVIVIGIALILSEE